MNGLVHYVHFIVFYSEQQELPRMLQERNEVDSPEELWQLQDKLYKIEASKAKHIEIKTHSKRHQHKDSVLPLIVEALQLQYLLMERRQLWNQTSLPVQLDQQILCVYVTCVKYVLSDNISNMCN